MGSWFGYMRIILAAAILLMADSRFSHAYEDSSCQRDHAASRHSGDSDHQECPVDHSCGQNHSHTFTPGSAPLPFVFVAPTSRTFFSRSDDLTEGALREIDYPPQLT